MTTLQKALAQAVALVAELESIYQTRSIGQYYEARDQVERACFDLVRLHGPEIEAAVRDAERYRKFRAWYLRDGRRSEIDPVGHIRFTTPEIIDAALDAMQADGGG